MKKVCVLISLVFIAVSVFGQKIEDFEIEIINGTVTITDYSGSQKAVCIPKRIHKMPVTAIAEFAFSEKQLTSVLLPNSVTSIGVAAFSNNEISNLIIPNSVTHIGVGAFSNNRLKNVTISKNLTSIEAGVFSDNEISNVIIPKNITSIGIYAFYNNKMSNVRLPAGITFIGDYAFSGITLIAIDDDVEINEQSVFHSGFFDLYNKKGKSAGTYWVDFASGKWLFMPKLHIVLMGTDDKYPVEI
jgi:hypothetical protein